MGNNSGLGCFGMIILAVFAYGIGRQDGYNAGYSVRSMQDRSGYNSRHDDEYQKWREERGLTTTQPTTQPTTQSMREKPSELETSERDQDGI